MVLERVMRFVECKKDVVILLDSLIRFVCVYNLVELFFGRIFFGGFDLNVFYKFKKFFGVVRNFKEGGSFIIFVIVLIEIGL